MNEMTEEKKIVDGVDLSTLTADQLQAMGKEEWGEFLTVVQAGIDARDAEAKAALKEKIGVWLERWQTWALPVLKYSAGTYVVLRLAGVI